jgi:hypothetical protein
VAVAAHVFCEQDLRRDDLDTQAAIVSARHYFDAYAMLRRAPKRFGAKHFAYMYYGWQLPVHGSWLVSQ